MEKQLMQNIFANIEQFVKNNSSTCVIRLYLCAANRLYEFMIRLNEITEGNEPTDIQELQEINSQVESILTNLGINQVKK